MNSRNAPSNIDFSNDRETLPNPPSKQNSANNNNVLPPNWDSTLDTTIYRKKYYFDPEYCHLSRNSRRVWVNQGTGQPWDPASGLLQESVSVSIVRERIKKQENPFFQHEKETVKIGRKIYRLVPEYRHYSKYCQRVWVVQGTVQAWNPSSSIPPEALSIFQVKKQLKLKNIAENSLANRTSKNAYLPDSQNKNNPAGNFLPNENTGAESFHDLTFQNRNAKPVPAILVSGYASFFFRTQTTFFNPHARASSSLKK